MAYFITKYALTEGIIEVNEQYFKETENGIYGKLSPKHFAQGFYRKDWHRTLDCAHARAEEMRKAKISSLRKSIQKMENMRFDKVVKP